MPKIAGNASDEDRQNGKTDAFHFILFFEECPLDRLVHEPGKADKGKGDKVFDQELQEGQNIGISSCQLQQPPYEAGYEAHRNSPAEC